MSSEEAIGYGRPPMESKFQKGLSGNPRGRPKSRHRQIPHDAVLGQMVTVREDGLERRITAAEAFLMQLTRKGLAGDNTAARASLEAIEKARATRNDDLPVASRIIMNVIGDGVDTVIGTIGIAHRKYPTDEARVRWELNPWIVEAALARFGTRKLTVEEQREVWANTRIPHKVRWPEWWTEKA